MNGIIDTLSGWMFGATSTVPGRVRMFLEEPHIGPGHANIEIVDLTVFEAKALRDVLDRAIGIAGGYDGDGT